ncbi:MAG TPA: diacylglycerol kinase family protein [Pirellulales bacterium]|nr:diacylglycerol kinase family protein [Pirellulales bacterium]
MSDTENAAHSLPRGAIVVANPYSGARENRTCVEALAAALHERQLDCRIIWDLEELVEVAADPAAAEQYRVVVAAGGDGTLNRVINLQNRLPVFMFPLGNENLFSRQFGCCRDPRHAADVIVTGQTRRMDLGRAGDRLFAIVASAGFDGDAAHRLARWRQQNDGLRRVRSASYAAPILSSALYYRYPMLEIDADGRRLRAALCMVFNMPQYASNLPLAFDADPHDGLLDWIVFERPGNLPLAAYALSVWRNRHRQRRDVQFGRARRIVLAAAEPVPLEIDGEAADFAPVVIEVVPDAIQIVSPRALCACPR